MSPTNSPCESQSNSGHAARKTSDVFNQNLKIQGIGLLAWSLYYAFTNSLAVAVAPLLCTVVGLVLSLRLQPRPGGQVDHSTGKVGGSGTLNLLGRLLTVAGALPIMLGGLFLVWEGLQKLRRGIPSNLLSWDVVLTSMAIGWLLSVIGMWVTDQGLKIASSRADQNAETDRPFE